VAARKFAGGETARWDDPPLLLADHAMRVNDGHTYASPKKRPYVLDQIQGHQTGAACSQSGMGSGFPIPVARQRLARAAGPNFPGVPDGGLRAWLLLARALVPKRKGAGAERRLLGAEIQGEQGAGRKECAAPTPRRLVRADRMGVLLVDRPRAGGGNPKAAGRVRGKALCGCGLEWPWRGAGTPSRAPGLADNLVVDSRRRTGDATGGRVSPGVPGMPAELHSSPYMEIQRPTFIDLFSGCGGLSLGLSQAGWQGLFAIERATDAFETFRANFLAEGVKNRFLWPEWLAQSAHSIDDVLKHHEQDLSEMRGHVDLIAGGPPCQGFSFAGRRNSSDPRNEMFQRYVAFVRIINPKFLILENVPGMTVAHTKRGNNSERGHRTFYDELHDSLDGLGYSVSPMILDAADYGVPQHRERLVVVGIRSDVAKTLPAGSTGVFSYIDKEGQAQLQLLGNGKHVTAEQALSDLVVGSGKQRAARTIEYTGEGARRGYVQRAYQGPKDFPYQRLMNEGVSPEKMDSMRLARHRLDVEWRFQAILDSCRRGVNLSPDDRERFGMLKHRTVPMAKKQPAPTLTTLPDDILHYSDPRILTVRECARLQSFPDWFTFHGKYTTGGERRKSECPRYTQVGNAVPPLLARAIGVGVLRYWRSLDKKAGGNIGKRTVVKKSVAAAMR